MIMMNSEFACECWEICFPIYPLLFILLIVLDRFHFEYKKDTDWWDKIVNFI